MRTVTVRFSIAEHRLLSDLAAARGVSVEMLIREALALQPIGAHASPARRLRIVQADDAPAASGRGHDHAAPIG